MSHRPCSHPGQGDPGITPAVLVVTSTVWPWNPIPCRCLGDSVQGDPFPLPSDLN